MDLRRISHERGPPHAKVGCIATSQERQNGRCREILLLNDYQVFFGIPVSRVGKALGQFRRGAIGLIRVSTPPSAKKGTRTIPGYTATVPYGTVREHMAAR